MSTKPTKKPTNAFKSERIGDKQTPKEALDTDAFEKGRDNTLRVDGNDWNRDKSNLIILRKSDCSAVNYAIQNQISKNNNLLREKIIWDTIHSRNCGFFLCSEKAGICEHDQKKKESIEQGYEEFIKNNPDFLDD